jgi:hypothetical protein
VVGVSANDEDLTKKEKLNMNDTIEYRSNIDDTELQAEYLEEYTNVLLQQRNF